MRKDFLHTKGSDRAKLAGAANVAVLRHMAEVADAYAERANGNPKAEPGDLLALLRLAALARRQALLVQFQQVKQDMRKGKPLRIVSAKDMDDCENCGESVAKGELDHTRNYSRCPSCVKTDSLTAQP